VPALLALALALALTVALTGCSEPGPVDDGSYSSLQAGAPAVLDDLGVTLVSLDEPAAARPAVVADALDAAGLDVLAYSERAVTGLAVDPDSLGGLLGAVGTPALGSDTPVAEQPPGAEAAGTLVVFAFDDVDAALFFAGTDPEVFADPALDGDRASYVAGNLVAYLAPAGAAGETAFVEALEGLAAS